MKRLSADGEDCEKIQHQLEREGKAEHYISFGVNPGNREAVQRFYTVASQNDFETGDAVDNFEFN